MKRGMLKRFEEQIRTNRTIDIIPSDLSFQRSMSDAQRHPLNLFLIKDKSHFLQISGVNFQALFKLEKQEGVGHAMYASLTLFLYSDTQKL